MRVGDLVRIMRTWYGYRVCFDMDEYVTEGNLVGIIKNFDQDLEVDENLDYKWFVNIVLPDGTIVKVHQEHVEVISESSPVVD